MSEKELYYGPGDVPKGKKRANIKEALEANQIRYYGVKKVDERIIKKAQKKDQNKQTIRDLQNKNIRLMVKIRKLIAQIKKEKDIKKKNKMKDEVRALAKEHNDHVNTINRLQKGGRPKNDFREMKEFMKTLPTKEERRKQEYKENQELEKGKYFINLLEREIPKLPKKTKNDFREMEKFMKTLPTYYQIKEQEYKEYDEKERAEILITKLERLLNKKYQLVKKLSRKEIGCGAFTRAYAKLLTGYYDEEGKRTKKKKKKKKNKKKKKKKKKKKNLKKIN